jgi:hypothetical protein
VPARGVARLGLDPVAADPHFGANRVICGVQQPAAEIAGRFRGPRVIAIGGTSSTLEDVQIASAVVTPSGGGEGRVEDRIARTVVDRGVHDETRPTAIGASAALDVVLAIPDRRAAARQRKQGRDDRERCRASQLGA